MDPRFHPRDEIKLVGAAMDLPDGERHEAGHDQKRGEIECDQPRELPPGQGFCRASCADIGIMF